MSAYESAYYVSENNNQEQKPKRQIYNLYMVTHLIISFFAVYLSWRCNRGFNLISFFVALVCPYLYIIWALATKGGCGIFNESHSFTTSPIKPITYY